MTPHIVCSNSPQIHLNNHAMCRFQQTMSRKLTKHSMFITTHSMSLYNLHQYIYCGSLKPVSRLAHSLSLSNGWLAHHTHRSKYMCWVSILDRKSWAKLQSLIATPCQYYELDYDKYLDLLWMAWARLLAVCHLIVIEISTFRTKLTTQGIINHLLHIALIRPRCMGCLSHGTYFK